MMFLRALIFVGATACFAADEQQLALELRAQADFDRLETAIHLEVPDTARCIQSQAALLPVARRGESALIHYRKGYCTLAGATITHNAAEYREASAEFEKAIEAWPERAVLAPKGSLPEPLSSGLRVLTVISRLKAGGTAAPADWDVARHELMAAIDTPVCTRAIMPANSCQSLLSLAWEWLGWTSLQRNDLFEAAKDFTAVPDSGWIHWASGRQAFADRRYKDAATQDRQALAIWTRLAEQPPSALSARLGPTPDLPEAYTALGGAQLLSGDPSRAIANLDSALKSDPKLTRALFLRARAYEASGEESLALADYSLASRTAFANAHELASGEAHLYRGIVMYRRGQYEQAEDEFASALNFEIPEGLKPDAEAWRFLAAVAGGACTTSRQNLEEALARVSPFFPKDEARRRAAACPLTGGPSTASVARPADSRDR